MAAEQREDQDTRVGRSLSFGAVARAYADYRPGYPDTAVRWVLEPLGSVGARRPLDVLDLAAGTGKLTGSLVGLAEAEGIASVTAVEPDPAMLDLLRAELPAVEALAGTAEAIPLPDASVDAVFIGQAMHWMDIEPATAEFVRVLRPGGVVAALWNGEDDSPEWVRGYRDVTEWARRTGRTSGAHPGFAEHAGLGPTAAATFDNPVPMTIDRLLSQLGTYSWISTLPEAERRDTMERARAYLTSRPELGAGSGSGFELPLRTDVLRAVSRAERR